MSTIKLLAKCMHLIRIKKVCPETPMEEWPRIVLFAHSRGYLYTNKDGSAFAMVYRIPEWDEKWTYTMPEKESGNKAYVGWAVSESNDPYCLTKMFKSYVKLHGIQEMIYHRRNSNTDLKRIITEKKNVEEKVAQRS